MNDNINQESDYCPECRKTEIYHFLIRDGDIEYCSVCGYSAPIYPIERIKELNFPCEN